jgi:hypothetical protein
MRAKLFLTPVSPTGRRGNSSRCLASRSRLAAANFVTRETITRVSHFLAEDVDRRET